MSLTIRRMRGIALSGEEGRYAMSIVNDAVDFGYVELDRAIGAVIGSAVGDALGAGYEFVPAPEPGDVTMLPGTLTGEPAGYWTDDTAMAIAILEVAGTLGTLTSEHAAVAVGERFLEWYRSGPRDVGNQIRAVLSRATTGEDLASAAAAEQESDPDRAGNGSLMRTGPVALAHLGDEEGLASAARAMSALTHPNPYALDACVLWTLAIDHAIRTGELAGPRVGLHLIEEARRAQWEQWIDDAESLDPRRFSPNGYVVTALQAAWSAIHSTRESPDHLVSGLRQAVSIGNDTDTVAAIAGSLLGARYGVSSVPFEWRHGLAGWPEQYRGIDLVRLAVRAANRGRNDTQGGPDAKSLSDHYEPLPPAGVTATFDVDSRVTFGDFRSLARVEADSFISLCWIGTADQQCVDHKVVWLIGDEQDVDAALVLVDTADAIAYLSGQGQRVFVHGVKGESRTPTVAMAWLMRHHGRSFDQAYAEVMTALPFANPHPALLRGVRGAGATAQPVEEDHEWLREFIGTRRWQRGKADPTHEYTIRSWVPEGEDEFGRAVAFIRDQGRPAQFFSNTYIYLTVDGMKYWTMGDPVEDTQVLNRADS